MAKALLFLKAANGSAPVLLTAVRSLAETAYAAIQDCGSTLQVMASLEEDPLCNRPRPNHFADVTIEIKTQPGQPLAPALADWDNLAGQLGECLDAEQSLALVMHEHCWRLSAPQPIYYHYLMVRRADFSPADYSDYYLHYHKRFGMITPGIEAYSQNMIDQPSSKKLCQKSGLGFYEVTSISEMQMRDIDTFLSSPAMAEIGPDAGEDEAQFVDRAASVMFCSSIVLSLGDQSTIGDSCFV
jgi:hypothetical protein